MVYSRCHPLGKIYQIIQHELFLITKTFGGWFAFEVESLNYIPISKLQH